VSCLGLAEESGPRSWNHRSLVFFLCGSPALVLPATPRVLEFSIHPPIHPPALASFVAHFRPDLTWAVPRQPLVVGGFAALLRPSPPPWPPPGLSDWLAGLGPFSPTPAFCRSLPWIRAVRLVLIIPLRLSTSEIPSPRLLRGFPPPSRCSLAWLDWTGLDWTGQFGLVSSSLFWSGGVGWLRWVSCCSTCSATALSEGHPLPTFYNPSLSHYSVLCSRLFYSILISPFNLGGYCVGLFLLRANYSVCHFVPWILMFDSFWFGQIHLSTK